jgi:hypothetical protein
MPAMSFLRISLPLAIPLGLAALAGCGGGVGTVSGDVTYRGKPLKSGSVILYCSDKQIVRGAVIDGRYSIPNVPFGQARVTVQARPRSPTGLRLQQNLPPMTNGPVQSKPPAGEPDESIPERYSLPEESGLAFTVDSRHVVYEINLTP